MKRGSFFDPTSACRRASLQRLAVTQREALDKRIEWNAPGAAAQVRQGARELQRTRAAPLRKQASEDRPSASAFVMRLLPDPHDAPIGVEFNPVSLSETNTVAVDVSRYATTP